MSRTVKKMKRTVAALPQTFSEPLAPPLFSAIPSFYSQKKEEISM